MKQVKCKICGEKDDKQNLVCEEKKKTIEKEDEFGLSYEQVKVTRTYYHESCKAERESKKASEKEFYTYLENLFDVYDVPTYFITIIKKFQSEKDVSTEMLFEAYKQSEDTIRWCLQNKRFDSTIAAMKYTWQVVLDSLSKIATKQKHLEKQQKMAQIQVHHMNDEQVVYKKKKTRNNDISDFL
jgi:hypothetical protein